MIPLRDENPTTIVPFITVGIILLNLGAFLYELSFGEHMQRFIYAFGAIPYEIIHQSNIQPGVPLPVNLTLFTSMFLHGGVIHITGNMLYLWIFGNNIEDAMGHIKFILFYLICGIIAVFCHTLANKGSRVPMIGASGAVAGILGAYIVLYPRAKVLTLIVFGFFFRIVKIPAVFVIGIWLLLQLVQSTHSTNSSGVAWFAHIGGFFAGMIAIFFFKKR